MQPQCLGYTVEGPIGIVIIAEAPVAEANNSIAEVFHDGKIFSRLGAQLTLEESGPSDHVNVNSITILINYTPRIALWGRLGDLKSISAPISGFNPIENILFLFYHIL